MAVGAVLDGTMCVVVVGNGALESPTNPCSGHPVDESISENKLRMVGGLALVVGEQGWTNALSVVVGANGVSFEVLAN